MATVTSTQDVARTLPVGTVVVADHQTAGRGRLGRRFEAPPGTALLASWVMPAHTLAPIAAGVAAAQACGDEVRLKWPNDLLLGGRKLGGILVERIGQKCVVGTGINLHWAPPGAALLSMDRDELLVGMEREMPHWFGASGAEVCAAWRQRSDTLGRLVRVELPGETFEGIAQDLGSDGSLIVGGRRVTAGDVVHLEEADSPPRS